MDFPTASCPSPLRLGTVWPLFLPPTIKTHYFAPRKPAALLDQALVSFHHPGKEAPLAGGSHCTTCLALCVQPLLPEGRAQIQNELALDFSSTYKTSMLHRDSEKSLTFLMPLNSAGRQTEISKGEHPKILILEFCEISEWEWPKYGT